MPIQMNIQPSHLVQQSLDGVGPRHTSYVHESPSIAIRMPLRKGYQCASTIISEHLFAVADRRRASVPRGYRSQQSPARLSHQVDRACPSHVPIFLYNADVDGIVTDARFGQR